MALADAFIVDVRDACLRGGAADVNATDASVLRHADIEVQKTFIPFLKRLRSEYLVRRQDVPVTAGNRVRLPRRAVAGSVRLVQWLGDGGNIGGVLSRLMLEDGATLGPATLSSPAGWYWDGASVVLAGAQPGAAAIRVWYEQRPGKLALTVSCRRVDAVTVPPTGLYTPGVTATLDLSGVPAGAAVDVISDSSSHHYVCTDAAATIGDPSTVTGLWNDTPDVGDYLCPVGTTCVVPVPEEAYAALVDLVAARVQRAGGYAQHAGELQESGMDALKQLVDTMAPRAPGNPVAPRRGLLAKLRGGW